MYVFVWKPYISDIKVFTSVLKPKSKWSLSASLEKKGILCDFCEIGGWPSEAINRAGAEAISERLRLFAAAGVVSWKPSRPDKKWWYLWWLIERLGGRDAVAVRQEWRERESDKGCGWRRANRLLNLSLSKRYNVPFWQIQPKYNPCTF